MANSPPNEDETVGAAPVTAHVMVVGSIVAKPATLERLLAASVDHVRRSRAEDGCLTHQVSIDAENPLRLHFFEIWRDRPALKAHFSQAGSGVFVAAVRGLAKTSEGMRMFDVRVPPNVI